MSLEVPEEDGDLWDVEVSGQDESSDEVVATVASDLETWNLGPETKDQVKFDQCKKLWQIEDHYPPFLLHRRSHITKALNSFLSFMTTNLPHRMHMQLTQKEHKS